jgi:acetolactate synthase I/II/III large subunit
MELTGSEILVKELESAGIDTVFGIPGGPTMSLYDALSKSKSIKHYLTRHEGGASFLADGYAKSHGKPAVCLATAGPGATNLVIGVATAYTDSTPMIALTGQVGTNVEGRDLHDEINLVEMFKPVTKLSIKVHRTDRLSEIVGNAIRIATEGRPGPVHICLPDDVLSSKVEYTPRLRRGGQNHVIYGDPSKISHALKLLINAKQPVILVGGGAVYNGLAHREIKQLSELLGTPVATSYNGRGVVPEDHPLCLGRVGEFTPKFSNEYVKKADVIISFGHRFTEASTNNWQLISPQSTLIQVDVDPYELGKIYPNAFSIQGDSKAVAKQLIEASKGKIKKNITLRGKETAIEITANKRKYWKPHLKAIEKRDGLIKPQYVMKTVRDTLKRDAIIVADAGSNKRWAGTLLEIYEPRTWIHSGGFAPMGYTIPAAIGAKIANPEKQVLGIIGDRAYNMMAQELLVAVEHNLPVIIIVFNDYALGVIKLLQQAYYNNNLFACEYKYKQDIAENAKTFGANAERIDEAYKLKPALLKALEADKPTVLDVIIDPNESILSLM